MAGLAVGSALGRELIGGSVGLTFGLVIGGGIGKALQSVATSHRKKARMTQADRQQPKGKASRSYAAVSVLLGFASIVLAFGPIILLPLLVIPLDPRIAIALAALCALVGLGLSIYQVIRVRSGRIVASGGILLSLVGGGLSALVAYGMFTFAATQADILVRMGYPLEIIDNPISVELFETVDQPAVQWIYSGAVAPVGWYADGQEALIPIEIPLAGTEPTTPVSFGPSGEVFGFFMRVEGVYEWFTESGRNGDGNSHVRVYPMLVDGVEVPNSYLICWEDYPLDMGPNRFVDFTDLIMRVDGVAPVTPQKARLYRRQD